MAYVSTKISVGRADEKKRGRKVFSVRRADEKFSSDENEKKNRQDEFGRGFFGHQDDELTTNFLVSSRPRIGRI